MVESMFGIPAIISEALEHLVPDAYSRAILQEELQPIDQPELDLSEEVEIDKPVIFTATVPLRPTVELGEIESISLTKERPKVQDEEVEEVLLQFQQSRAELKPVEGRPLQEDDMAEMQLSIIAGEIEKTEDNPISVIVGQNWLPKGFDSKVMGMEVRDVRVFELDVPETYHDEDLRGTFATFTAELISMKAPELPDLTDDLPISKPLWNSEPTFAKPYSKGKKQMPTSNYRGQHWRWRLVEAASKFQRSLSTDRPKRCLKSARII